MADNSPFVAPEVLARFHTEPKICNYLPSETACLEYRAIVNITPAQYLHMLERGWRRFGIFFFRPACGACSKCISLRICASTFQPSQSQRRTAAKNKGVKVIVQPASCSMDHIELFHAYHRFMREHRGWPENRITPREYIENFLGPFSFAHEFLYIRNGKLAGVGLVDILPGNATSSIYFYHDPEWRNEAPGVFSLLNEMRIAREQNAPFNYLGYWVNDCRSMAYKAQYKPHQLLHGYPADDEVPNWIDGSTSGIKSTHTLKRDADRKS